MASNIYLMNDEVVYKKGIILKDHPSFSAMFYYKKVREGVEVLATKPYEGYHYETYPFFDINPIKGKTLDKNNKILCDGDVNVLNIFSNYSRVVFAWKPRCIVTLLGPMEDGVYFEKDVLEFNYNEDEINEYIKEQQIEKYKEEIKAAELKKALK